MAEDIGALLARLITSSRFESVSVTVVLKPDTVTPPPADAPLCVFKIGPVSSKE
jgi:hypothetical protein